MIISSIKLNNFRCHGDFSYDFKKKTSVIVGENGSGKTSVLEAIYEALRGKSFRAVDSDILRRESDFYRIEVNFSDGERTVVAFGDLDASHELKKQFLVGGKKYTRLPKKYRYPIVLFLPDDLHLLSSSPTKKRDFFDRILSELNDSYTTILNRYEKALKQRNDLLKSFADGSAEELRSVIFSWNLLLAKYGTEIRKERQKFVSELNKRLTNTYRAIAGGDNGDEVVVKYKLQGEDVSEEEYFKRLESELNRDLILGHTGFGVHRDSYEFIFNNHNEADNFQQGIELALSVNCKLF